MALKDFVNMVLLVKDFNRRELRDALACSIYSGTNEMQKNTIYEMIKMTVL